MRAVLLTVLALAALGSACSSEDASRRTPPEDPPASPTRTPKLADTATPTPRLEIIADRLVIPSLGIDSPVQKGETVPYRDIPPPGCPGLPEDTTTVTVPAQGIATPADEQEGLENKTWIYGHSRWLGAPGLFFRLSELKPGDEVLVDGVVRESGNPARQQRYVVNELYLTDKESGEKLLTAHDQSEIPGTPVLYLQTSVRETGGGKPWILDRPTLLATATNLVEGNLDDPCKYLLLFVKAVVAN